jgi:hypothetical protein
MRAVMPDKWRWNGKLSKGVGGVNRWAAKQGKKPRILLKNLSCIYCGFRYSLPELCEDLHGGSR